MRNRPIYASALGGYGLCNAELARPAYAPHRILVHRLACLFHASFRPRFAATPLRFTNPSPPSGWVEDFHFLAAGHAQHTLQPPSGGLFARASSLGFANSKIGFSVSTAEPPRKAAAAKIGCPTSTDAYRIGYTGILRDRKACPTSNFRAFPKVTPSTTPLA